MNTKKFYLILILLTFQTMVFAQNKKPFIATENNDNIIMTWNKNTPETEMKEDIKALQEKGITIKYSKLKRNANNEITGLKIDYLDRQGNKGSMELDNQKPITTIQFFKQDGQIGFGQPENSNDLFAGNDIFKSFGGNDMMKQFRFQIENDSLSQGKFNFASPEILKQSKSKIIIQNSNKKPLVIEDGKVVEGGEDYTKDELDEIMRDNKVDQFSFGGNNEDANEFDFRNKEGLDNFKNQMQKMQSDFDKIKPNSADSDFDKTKEEMQKAKEEMIKAKEELQKAKKELDKKQVSKTQKT